MGRIKEKIKTVTISKKEIKKIHLFQCCIRDNWGDEEGMTRALNAAALGSSIVGIFCLGSVLGPASIALAMTAGVLSSSKTYHIIERGATALGDLENFFQEFEDDVEAVKVEMSFLIDEDNEFQIVEHTDPKTISKVLIDGDWQVSPYVRCSKTSFKEVDPLDIDDDRDASNNAEDNSYKLRFRRDKLEVEDPYYERGIINGRYHTEYYRFKAPKTDRYDITFESRRNKLRLYLFDLDDNSERILKLTSNGNKVGTIERLKKNHYYLIGITSYKDRESRYDLTIEY